MFGPPRTKLDDRIAKGDRAVTQKVKEQLMASLLRPTEKKA